MLSSFKWTVLTLWLTFLVTSCGSDGKSVGTDTGNNDLDVVADLQPPPDVPEYIMEIIDTWDVTEGSSKDVPPEDSVQPDGDAEPLDAEDVAEPDETPEDTGPDGCVPQCMNSDGSPKGCGPDSCGSICGYCGYGEQCVECDGDEPCEVSAEEDSLILEPGDAVCLEICVPSCGGKQCGFDGCYGTCPPGCDEGFQCGDDGQCYPDCDHEANCEEKDCGSDGCGGVCGICGLGMICDDEQQCVPHPCGNVPEDKGKCEGNTLVECLDLELVETVCSDLGVDFHCKWDAPQQKYVCAEGCVPQCELEGGGLKECGPDGCGSLCGECPQGWSCEEFQCKPVAGGGCGWITATGECDGNTLWFCTGGILYKEECDDTGTNCMFDQGLMKYRCY